MKGLTSLLQLVLVLVVLVLMVGMTACAPPQGYHYEQIWTNQPDVSARKPSWLAGRYLSCTVQDRTYIVTRCM